MSVFLLRERIQTQTLNEDGVSVQRQVPFINLNIQMACHVFEVGYCINML